MDEEWIINSAKGKGNTINFINWTVVFTKNGESLDTNGVTTLREPIAGTSSLTEIIRALHDNMGDIRLESIRSSARRRIDDALFREEQSEEYYTRDVRPEDVDFELNRRLSQGVVITVPSVGDIRVSQGTAIREVGITGLLRQFGGGAGSDRPFVDADGVEWMLSPRNMIDLYNDWDEYSVLIESKAKALKDMSPIPKDYKNDSYWQ